jgi:2',3'-cyclic-nucleotide 2'-phosphodiesterase (5'-nucleotidase family)
VLEFEMDGSLTERKFEKIDLTYVPTTKTDMQKFLKIDPEKWDTEKALIVRNAIQEKMKTLGLDKSMGCAPETYLNDFEDKTIHSLYNLYTNFVFPKCDINKLNGNNTRLYMTNSGSLRSGLHAGPLTYDDIISVDPFQNTFCYIQNITTEDLKKLMDGDVDYLEPPSHLMEEDEDARRMKWMLEGDGYEYPFPIITKRMKFSDRFYVTNKTIKEKQKYDIGTNSYDCPFLLKELNSASPTYTMTETDSMTMDAMIDYVHSFMICSSSSSSIPSWTWVLVVFGVLGLVGVGVLVIVFAWKKVYGKKRYVEGSGEYLSMGEEQ